MARKDYTKRIDNRAAKAAKPEDLSDMEAAFLRHYLADPERNGTRAALKAGYSPRSASVSSTRLLKRPQIKARIIEADSQQASAAAKVEKAAAKGAAKALAALGREDDKALAPILVTKEMVATEIAKSAFTSMADFLRVSEDGDPILDLSRANANQLAAIQEVTIEDFKDGRGENARDVRKVKFKLYDRNKAGMDLARLLGFYVEKRETASDLGTALATLLAGMSRSALPLDGASISGTLASGVPSIIDVTPATEEDDPEP